MTGRLERPQGEALATELRKGRGARWRVTAMFLVLVMLLAGGAAYYRHQQQHECDVARKVRQHDEQLQRDLFARLGHRMGASQSEIDSFLTEEISAAYDAMPTPAAC